MQVGLDSGLHLQLLSMNLLNSQESPDPWAELVTWEKENNSTQVCPLWENTELTLKIIIILKKDPKVQPMYRIAMRKKQMRNNKLKIVKALEQRQGWLHSF